MNNYPCKSCDTLIKFRKMTSQYPKRLPRRWIHQGVLTYCTCLFGTSIKNDLENKKTLVRNTAESRNSRCVFITGDSWLPGLFGTSKVFLQNSFSCLLGIFITGDCWLPGDDYTRESRHDSLVLNIMVCWISIWIHPWMFWQSTKTFQDISTRTRGSCLVQKQGQKILWHCSSKPKKLFAPINGRNIKS